MIMQIIAVVVLTVLPGAWITFGLRLSRIPFIVRLAMAVALSPPTVGLQLAALEAVGIPFAATAYALPLINLPSLILVARHLRANRISGNLGSWLSFMPLLVFIVAIPIIIWSSIPGLRVYEWETMLHTDVVYTIVRDGVNVEETNLAGLNLAYGWIGHSYWSLIGWIIDWPPTKIYPITNVLWIVVTFVLGFQLGKLGLGLHKMTSLLGVALLFLSTNVIGLVLLLLTGYSEWWANYFGDIRYSPFLSKFHGFDTMLWGMALLVALALVYTVALQRKITSLNGITISLLIGLGLVYPLLFPAGFAFSGCFLFLVITNLAKGLTKYSRGEILKTGFSVLFSTVVIVLYLRLLTADRDVAAFALSSRGDIKIKSIRFFWAMGPFIAMAGLPFFGFIRRRYGPAVLLALPALAFSAVYIFIDLQDLEYKYVLAGTICMAFLAAAVVDSLFRRRPQLGLATGIIVGLGLAVISLLMVFQAGVHLPGNLDKGASLDEGSFWLSLEPSDQDFYWTSAIHELTSEDTVVIARKPGIKLSVIVARSMYIPSDTDGGHLPGYNLNQRFYLLEQRGYPVEEYDRRLEVEDILYASEDDAKIIEALHYLKELHRPMAIYYPSQNIYSLGWLESHAIGEVLFTDGRNTVWLVDDPNTLP